MVCLSILCLWSVAFTTQANRYFFFARPPSLPASMASSRFHVWAVPFAWAAFPPLLAICLCLFLSIEAKPRPFPFGISITSSQISPLIHSMMSKIKTTNNKSNIRPNIPTTIAIKITIRLSVFIIYSRADHAVAPSSNLSFIRKNCISVPRTFFTFLFMQPLPSFFCWRNLT